MEAEIHAELRCRSTQYLRGQPLNVWSCVRTPVVGAAARTRIAGDCFLDDRVGKRRRVDTITCVRGSDMVIKVVGLLVRQRDNLECPSQRFPGPPPP